jgi:HK97 family phage portal protein
MLEGFWSGIKAFIGTDKAYEDYRIPYLKYGKNFDLSAADKIATVYTCVDILSKTLAKLPCEKYIENNKGKEKDKSSHLYSLLHYAPNNYTSSQAFFQALETNRNLRGNSFAHVHRNKYNGKAERLEIILPWQVKNYIIIEGDLFYHVQLNKESDKLTVVSAFDLLHFKGITRDGVWGLNPIEALKLNLSSTHKGLTTIDSFYDNNANSPRALKSSVSGANQKTMLEAVKQFNNDFAGAENSGLMLPLPPNTEIQELKLNFADAQFIETVKFNANQIAALYGIPAHMVGNTEASKFNNVEQMSIEFKGNTISPIARMYRQELEMKLLTPQQRANGESIEFNLNAMIETDHQTRFEGYYKLFQCGAISPNDINRIENMPISPEGEDRYIPMNLHKLGSESKENKTI